MSTQPSPQFLDVPGGRLYYEVRGSGPLLLVIGQPMTSAPFGPLADLLAADHTVLTYDPHGLGASTVEDPSLDVTPEIEADDLAYIINAVGGDRADVFGSSGGAVAALAFAARHPDKAGTVIAHEPPVTELLPDARHVRTAVDDIDDAYRAYGSGAAWGKFVSLVMHDGPVTEAGVRPAAWPPGSDGAEAQTQGGADSDGVEIPPEALGKQQADDELFFLRMLKPFTRYQPPVEVLSTGGPRVIVAVGVTSGSEIARRSAETLAERIGTSPIVFPGDHGGFMADPAAFAGTIRQVLAESREDLQLAQNLA
ncbi:MAG TPA: alpha/beta hydrolase [Propionibacteriaceae bacterium]|nr:alpha/beta hydrolase [Propionibacteriaceae bacterium]